MQNITASIPSELPRALSIATSIDPLVVQLFYFSGTALQQVQYTNNKWSIGLLDSSVPQASTQNGPVGAVGWDKTAVRLYYLIDGKIKQVMGERINAGWVLSTDVGLEYD